MRLTTIWTMPAMSPREKIRRTGDELAQIVAAHLPKRLKYWATVQSLAHVTTNELSDRIVPEIGMMEALKHVEGGPK